MTERKIEIVAVLGAGTMGSGLAALCAEAGCRVLLFDVSRDVARSAIARMTEGRAPLLEDAALAERIEPADIKEDIARVREADWICEAIIEDRAAKRALFGKVESHRRDGSLVSTNTSGIPLRALTDGMPARLRRDLAVTHFFNPVKVMKLVELVPEVETSPDVVRDLAQFLTERMGKGVVYGKDTVSFIANRVGCFWMFLGLHKAKQARAAGLSMEEIDALLGRPVGIPPTGLYGLIDLIGLDVMDLVAKNHAANLPAGDEGRAFASLPREEQAMVERGQLGRKTGGGFYRLLKAEDGRRIKEVFDLAHERWRPARDVTLAPEHQNAETLLFADDAAGRFAWDVMGGTLRYAADLVPEIADDIVNVDRAMRWGFNWAQGPFEMLDALGPQRIAARFEAEGKPLPRMLRALQDAGAVTFYRAGGREQIGPDGTFHPVK